MDHPARPPSFLEFLSFFVLAYALSWWPIPLGQGLLAHGVSVAAVIVVAVALGRAGLGILWERTTQFRGGWWYLIGPAVIFFYHTIAFTSLNVLGLPMVHEPYLAISTVLLLAILGGQWEEIGWTGYALPRLQEYFGDQANSLLLAALALGVFRSIWHVPLYLTGSIPWFNMVFFIIAFQLIIAWIYRGSRGSVPAVILFHFVSNLFGALARPVYVGQAALMYEAIFIGVACVIAFVVWMPRWSHKPPPGVR